MLDVTHVEIEARSFLKIEKELQDLGWGAEDEHPNFGVTSRSNSTRASFFSRSYTLIKLTIVRNFHDGTEAGYATSFAGESRLFFVPTHS
jgi:hypothetical protein